MRKKRYLLAGSIVLLAGLLMIFLKIRMRQTIEASTISYEKQMELENTLEVSDTLEFQLMYRQVEIPYDSGTDTFYLPQTADGGWTWEDRFSLKEEGFELYWCEDPYWDTMEQAIKEGHAFSFLVSDGQFLRKGKIVFTGLPMIRLETMWQSEEENRYCKVSVWDPINQQNRTHGYTECYGFLTLRGRTSKYFPKKGWELSLTDENGEPYKTALLGLREDDDWKLNALYPDGTKVREKVCFDLWNALAAQTESPYDAGSKMEYFELILDGEYMGLYGAMEQIDYKQLSLEKEEDVLYKAYAWPQESYPDQYAPEKEEYGHLIKEADREITEELWEPLKEYVQSANFASENETWDSEIFYDYLEEHMDLDNFLNAELYIQMLYAYDNKYKNLYVAADVKEEGGYQLWRIPWDLNYSFGDRFSLENKALTVYQLEWSQELMKDFMLSETLLESGNEQFAEALNEKWNVLKKGIFHPEYVRKLAQGYQDYLIDSGAFARDAKRWPEGPHETSVEKIVEFHSDRLHMLDEHYTSYLNKN